MLTDLLIARLDIAFDHQTFDHLADIGIVTTAVKNFFGDTDLFFLFVAGVGMVTVDDAGGIKQVAFTVHLMKQQQILVVVVG